MASLSRGLASLSLDHKEGAANGHAKMEATCSALDSAVELIQNTLRSVEHPRGRKTAPWNQSRRMMKPGNVHSQKPREANAGGSHVKNLKEQMSAQGLKAITKTITGMATAIEPITTTFDLVLSESATKSYNATLNTVPVVGIKGNKIMYIQRRLNSTGTAIEETWSVFSGLPADVKVAPDATNVFLFSFAGSLCLAVGQKVWRKAHDRPDADEASRAKAMDDWPELYVEHWDKVGDAVLPAADLRGVVPYSTFSADRKAIDFHVVVLKADGSLAALEGLKAASVKPLAFGNGSGSAPKLVRIAYFDDQLVGYDDGNNMWSLKVNFTEKTFSVVDRTADTEIFELTADEAGLISVRNDGFLYRRAIKDGDFTWTKWIAQEDVAHLAVASPGAFLDLNSLTRALKAHYVDTQRDLHSVVNNISAFCATHEVYLDDMHKAHEQYTAATTDAAKHAVAVKQGRAFVSHAIPWAMIIRLSVDGSKESVRTMTDQVSNVHNQLEAELETLLEKLVVLQQLLKNPDGTVDRLGATFWGALGARFLGLAMAVIDSGPAIPGMQLSGGALAVGALVAAFLEGKKVSELSGRIGAETEAQVAGVTTVVTEMRTLVDSYENFHAKYDLLSSLWRGVSHDANSLGSMDDATAEKVGRELLEDASSVATSKQTTSELGDACKKYLATLHKQAISPAVSATGVSAHMLLHKQPQGHAHHGQSTAHRQNSHKLSASRQRDLHLHDAFMRHVQEAQGKLKAHDHNGYVAAINQARFVSFATIASAADVKVMRGQWFDVPALSSSASVWNGYHAPIHVGLMEGAAKDEISNAQRRLNGVFSETKPLVVSMLKQTVELGKTFRRWKAKFPQPPVSTGRVNPDLEKLKKESLQQCTAAEDLAARAYSRFSVFERQAQKWQQDREDDITASQDAIKAARATGEDGRVARLDTTISQWRELQQSGDAFYRNAYTWIRMCEQIGETLGGHIHNVLAALAHASEDPTLYGALMGTDWTKIVNDASSIVELLAAHTLHHGAANGASTVLTRSTSALVRSLSPDAANLGATLKSQAESAKEVFDALNAVTQLPASGLVAYWDDAKETKTTLLDVAHRMRDQYVQLVATEYDVVEKLYTLSILQAIRAYNYAEQGKIPLDALVKVSFQSFSAAYHVANRAAIEYATAATGFDSAMTSVNRNLASVQEKVENSGVDTSTMDEHKKEIVYSSLGDAIASAVSSPVAFAASGVSSSVTQTLIQSWKMRLDAAGTADNLKLAIRELRPPELTQLLHSLQLVNEHAHATATQLAAVQPQFRKLVDGLEDVSASLFESCNGLHELLQRASSLGALGTITADDASHIEGEWKKMGAAARMWMDVIDAQNISHVTFSVHT